MLRNIDKNTEALLLTKVLQTNFSNVIAKLGDIKLNKKQLKEFEILKKRYLDSEPIEYILGKTQFYHLELLVDKNVLIPRLETENLVDLVINEQVKRQENKKKIYVLDLACGSGCIGLAIAKSLPYSSVLGIDISKKAIDISRKNSKKNIVGNIKFKNVSINGFKARIKYDIIISNPPYIPGNALRNLPKSVKKYEPTLALNGFVNGERIILQVIKLISLYLKDSGFGYIEIHSKMQYIKLKGILDKYKLKHSLLKDQFNRYRYIRITF